MTLKTPLNVSPYYDDYDATKNFARILFRPKFAVQARELTQIQSMLQNQVSSFADHVFKDGAIVTGINSTLDNSVQYVKLYNSSNSVSVNVHSFSNATIRGLNSRNNSNTITFPFGVEAKVVYVTTGAEANTPNLKTLFVRYSKAANNGITKKLQPEQRFFKVGAAGTIANVYIGTSSTGNASIFHTSEGVIYARGHFISVPAQKAIISKYSSNGFARVGFTINETIVTSADDASLNDPASGSYNYNAPGAHRLKLTANLTIRSISSANTDDFYEFAQVANGIMEVASSQRKYSDIVDLIAKRTYDESGNYVVSPFDVTIKEHLSTSNNGGLYLSASGGDRNKLAVQVGPGKAYLNGYEYDNKRNRIVEISKANTSVELTEQNINVNYGNYVYIHRVAGEWDVDTAGLLYLHGSVINATSTRYTSNSTNYSTNVIGTARARSIVYDSGNHYPDGTAKYRLYLFDVKITGANKSFANVRSISATSQDSSSTKRGVADIVLSRDTSTSESKALIFEPALNAGIFPLPQNAIRRFRDSTGTVDTDIVFKRGINVGFNSSGVATLILPAGEWNTGLGTLSAAQKNENFYVTLTANATSTLTGTAAVVVGNTITGTSTLFNRELKTGDRILFGTNNYVRRVVTISSNTSMTITPQGPVTKTGLTIKKVFPKGQILDMDWVAHDTTSKQRRIKIDTTTQASLYANVTLDSTVTANVVYVAKKSAAQEASKTLVSNRYVIINLNTHPRTTSGPWELGVSDAYQIQMVRYATSLPTAATSGSDVTQQFVLDDGQRDEFYETSKIKKRVGSTLSLSATGYLLVKFSYFVPSYSTGFGYFSVDSYPVDDSNLGSNTTISTARIPIYISPKNGIKYDLRNCIDIRPVFANTVEPKTTVSSPAAPINPANSSSSFVSQAASRFLVPNENMIADLSYYLPRIDKLHLDAYGKFVVSTGTPNLTPQDPADISNAMAIATIYIPPYPSISSEYAKRIGDFKYMVTVRKTDNKRFTMRDIGALRDRINNLEYYTSVNSSEIDALNKKIFGTTGLDRFKNGIFVDTFAGFNKSMVSSADFKASINDVTNTLHPKFDISEVTLDYNAAASSNIRAHANSKIYTLNYSHELAAEQPFATTIRNAAGEFYYTFRGVMVIDPASDIWYDTTYLPDVNINAGGMSDNYLSPVVTNTKLNIGQNESYSFNADGTGGRHGAWEYTFAGVDQSDLAAINSARNLSAVNFEGAGSNFVSATQSDWSWNNGSSSSINGPATDVNNFQKNIWKGPVMQTITTFENQTRLIDDRVLDTSVIPFMRSRIINVKCAGLLPSARHFLFFDDYNMANYTKPTNSSYANTGADGAALVTDSTGTLYAQLRIPSDNTLRFRTGEHAVAIFDSPTPLSTHISSTSEATFVSAGSLQQRRRTYETTTVPVTTQVVQEATIIAYVEKPVAPVLNNSNIPQVSSVNEPTPVVVSSTETAITNTPVTASSVGNSPSDWINNNNLGTYDNSVDPLAQSFILSASAFQSSGVFLTELDLFFKTKSSTLPIIVQIREMINGFPGPEVIPGSTIIMPAADVNISSDGSTPTRFWFDNPIYVRTETEYAIVIKPASNSPDYDVWVSELGGTDLVSGNIVTKQPFAGVLFTSSNDRTWSIQQDEDLKFKLYCANFAVGTTGTVVMTNETANYFNVANVSNDFFGSEKVHGETRIRLAAVSNTGAGAASGVGTIARAITGLSGAGVLTGANGTITNIRGTAGADNTVYQLKDVPVATKFTTSTRVRFANGAVANVISITTPIGLNKYFKRSYANNQMHLANSYVQVANAGGTFVTTNRHGANNEFIVGEQVIGQLSSSKATLSSIDNLTLNTSFLNIADLKFADTFIDYEAKTSTASALGSAYDTITNRKNHNFISEEKRVFSRINEASTITAANKSFFVKATLSTNNKYLSPVVDLRRASTYVVGNIINNDNTSETNGTGGLAKAKYISKIVALGQNQDAEDLKVYLTAFKPTTSNIEVYAKLLHSQDTTLFDDRTWIELEQVTPSYIYSDDKSEDNIIEYEYTIPAANLDTTTSVVNYTNGLGAKFYGYKYFAIKIVMLSSVTNNPPIVHDVRAIALQA